MWKWALYATSIVFAVLALSQSPFGGGAANARLMAAVQPPQTQTAPPGPSHRAEMMKMHQQMMAEMKAGDAKLDQLVATMNAATGEAKIAPMAEVINELVRQQKAMHEHMGTMMQMR